MTQFPRLSGKEVASARGGAGIRTRVKVISLSAAVLSVGALGVVLASGASGSNPPPFQFSIPSGMPSAKAAVANQLNHQILEGQGRSAPKDAPALSIDVPSSDPLTPGIVNGVPQGPFPPADFQIGNYWQGPVKSQWFVAYAGMTQGAPAIRVFSRNRDPNEPADLTLIGTFSDSTSASQDDYSIVDASGSRLKLSDGATFDLDTLQFG